MPTSEGEEEEVGVVDDADMDEDERRARKRSLADLRNGGGSMTFGESAVLPILDRL